MIRIEPFASRHVPAAAALLVERHRLHRRRQPLLPRLDDAQQRVGDLIGRPGASGACVTNDGQVTGFLVGAVTDEDVFGRHVVVDQAGMASRHTEQLRDLYAYAARRWIRDGACLHLVHVPAISSIVDAWFRLGFGHMQAYGLRRTGSEPAATPVAVRVAGRDALDQTGELRSLVWRHQITPPTSSGRRVPTAAVLRRSWREVLAEPGARYLVAEHEGRMVGHALALPADPGLATRGAVALVVCATLPDARRLGVASALCSELLAWAQTAGYAVMTTDWRVTNLEASRFWPQRGFRPVFYRLCRMVAIG